MEENIMKPDVVLVTKDVMVPLALPPSANQIAIGTSVLKKKTKIIKMRRNKLPENRPLSFFRNDNCERLKSQKKEEYEGDIFYNNVDSCKNFENRHDSKETIEIFQNRYDLVKPMKNLEKQHHSEKSMNFEKEDDTRYEIPYNHKLIKSSDSPRRANSKPMLLSLSLSAADIPKLVHKLSHDTLPLSSSSRSLELNEESSKAEEASFTHMSQWQGIDKDCEIKTNLKSSDNDISIRKDSSTEINFSHSTDTQPDEPENYHECRIKYSWEDLENWIPPSQKKNLENNEKKSEVLMKAIENKNLDCRIKYSWQIIGTGVQTSEDLIQSLVDKEKERNENYPCTVKYSWQIIGTGTQVSFRENAKDPSKYERDYWDGKILKKTKGSRAQTSKIGVSPKCKILYSEQSQTTSDKVLQVDTSNCEVKYSWQNLTKPYLQITKKF